MQLQATKRGKQLEALSLTPSDQSSRVFYLNTPTLSKAKANRKATLNTFKT